MAFTLRISFNQTGIMTDIIVGIDIAKDTFEAALMEKESGRVLAQKGFENSPGGYSELLETIRQSQAEPNGAVHVVMEATGHYHQRLSMRLAQEGVAQSIVNPYQVKRFSDMKLRRVKTDRSDAVLLAQYGREQKPAADEPSETAQEQLKQISTLIDQLTKQRTALKNQRHAFRYLPESAQVCDEVIDEQLEQLDENIKTLKEQQEELAADTYGQTKDLIESVIGVGQRTSCALLALAGDLSSFTSHKQLVAFMGLNPVPDQSGTINKSASISKQGHAKLRTLFFMAAQSARKYNTTCKEMYERLRARGKKKKQALIAVANKLTKQVFAVVKSRRPFDNDYQQKISPTS